MQEKARVVISKETVHRVMEEYRLGIRTRKTSEERYRRLVETVLSACLEKRK